MDISPGLSYTGALKIMGSYEHPVIRALDRFAGGVILGSALSPLNLLDLVDPKNEAAGLLEQAVSAMAGQLYGTAGYRRGELITAAHAVLVTSAFFEALRTRLGEKHYDRFKLTKADKRALAIAESAEARNADRLIEAMAKAPIPLPSATMGWSENMTGPIRQFMAGLAGRTLAFLEGLEGWRTAQEELAAEKRKERRRFGMVDEVRASDGDQVLTEDIVKSALANYKDMCQRFAADIPEFRTWLAFREHAATRTAVRRSHDRLAAEFAKNSRALDQLEQTLLAATHEAPRRSLRTALADLNAAMIDRPIVATDDTLRRIGDVAFPTIRDGYIASSYRIAVASELAQPSRVDWWEQQQRREDLEQFLECYLQDVASWRSPLVVLGHPGAGKSLLTTVLAGRLPATRFATVRVALRTVPAGAPLFQQITHSLHRQTNGRMTWKDLTEESRDVTRVVLLDGLDELIQATGVTQSNYLLEVAEFQRQELEMGSPVMVIVTSRLIVADRTALPDRATLLKLEDFDRTQVSQWLDVWRSANQQFIDRGSFRLLTLDSALRHADLVRQPLLLMMLALYVAGQEDSDDTGLVISQSVLYKRLLENFVRREIAKFDDGPSPVRVVDEDAVREHLWRLGLAAFAMFNRGRQQVSEVELDHDFEAISRHRRRSRTRRNGSMDAPLTDAILTIGKFFFVHAAEADGHISDQTRRIYEFLHATFGEYLIAATTVRLLTEAAWQRAMSGGAPYRADVQEPILAALLSHQPFVKRHSIMEFVQEAFAELPAGQSVEVAVVLEDLCRHSGYVDFGEYNPSSATAVARTAAYTANLVSLRMLLSAPVPLPRLAPDDVSPHMWWLSTIRTWHAGLDPEGWAIVLKLFRTRTIAGAETAEQLIAVQSHHPDDSWHNEALEDLQGAVMADPVRAFKYALGDLVTRYTPLQSAEIMPVALCALLELSFRPPLTRRRELYALILAERLKMSHATNAMLLACLAKDAEYIPETTAVWLFEALMSARWNESPDLAQLAQVIMATFPAIMKDHKLRRQGRLTDFGSRTDWTLAFARAVLNSPGPWPDDDDGLVNRIGEYVVSLAEWVDLIYPPGDPAATAR